MGTFSVTKYVISVIAFNAFGGIRGLRIKFALINSLNWSTFINRGLVKSMFAFRASVLVVYINFTFVYDIQYYS